jgi:hypothetical protein
MAVRHPNPKQGAIDFFTTTTVNGRPHMPDLLPEQVLPTDSIHGSFHDIAITSLSGEAQGDLSELLASVLLLQACWQAQRPSEIALNALELPGKLLTSVLPRGR